MQTIIYRSSATQFSFFRLELNDILNRVYNSSVIRITKQNGDIGVKAYPNPAGEYVTLSKFSIKENVIKVLVMTSLGKILFEQQFTLKSGSNFLKIPTGKLPKGQYILSVYDTSTDERQTSIIIK